MMTRERELLQQALDALERVRPQVRGAIPVADVKDGIAALREALAADHLRDVAEKAAPVPLTDSELAKIAVEDEFLLYCDQDSFNEIARAIELAHGITGGKP